MKLTQILKSLPANQHQEIRAAYYRAAEGLSALAKALEVADADLAGKTPLLGLHFTALEAEEILERTKLGAFV